MSRQATRLFTILLLTAFALGLVSCESEERPQGPTDSISGLPWNRPMPGERSGPMGAMQSH